MVMKSVISNGYVKPHKQSYQFPYLIGGATMKIEDIQRQTDEIITIILSIRKVIPSGYQLEIVDAGKVTNLKLIKMNNTKLDPLCSICGIVKGKNTQELNGTKISRDPESVIGYSDSIPYSISDGETILVNPSILIDILSYFVAINNDGVRIHINKDKPMQVFNEDDKCLILAPCADANTKQ